MIHKFISHYKSQRGDRAYYFKEARDEMASTNLHTLRTVSLANTFLLIIFILITPLIVPEWKVSATYILFIPCCLFFWHSPLLRVDMVLRADRLLTQS